MANGNSMMQLEQGAGWTRGLRTLLRGELGQWFGSRRWLSQILIWALIINGITLAVFFSAPEEAGREGLMVFCIFTGMAPAVGISIFMMESVAGEKRSGTAAWVLSKPVSRAAFLVSKWVANALGAAVTMILAQGLIFFLLMRFVGGVRFAVPGFIAGLAVLLLNLLFYISLTLMLGDRADNPGAVIGPALAFIFGQQYLPSLAPFLRDLLPLRLAMPMNGENAQSIAMALITGGRLPTLLPVVSTALLCTVFVGIALWVFERQEL